jgi:hypothetical protein
MAHKFDIGQLVELKHDSTNPKLARGAYRVLRHAPLEDADYEPTYRIQSVQDGHERVAKESTLVPAEPNA